MRLFLIKDGALEIHKEIVYILVKYIHTSRINKYTYEVNSHYLFILKKFRLYKQKKVFKFN